jgi:mannose-6-phosphate isomerase-like protein (cupin superfamily)
MKTIKLLITLLVVISLNLNCLSQEKNSGQTINYKTGNPADWPKELDAVVSAPKNHKILLENESVRVLEVTLAPGEVENLHHHQWPSVLYIQEAGDFIDYDGDGKVTFDSRNLPEPLTFPLTMYKDPEAPHSVVNLSDTVTIRLIRVEIKQ